MSSDYPHGDADPDTCPHPADRLSRRPSGDVLCRRCSRVVGRDGGQIVITKNLPEHTPEETP